MRIYRRPETKVWQYYWRGKRGSTGFTDKVAAENWFREFQRREADPSYRRASEASARTVGDALDEFIDRRKEAGEHADGTIGMYELHAAIINEHFTPERSLSTLDATALDSFISWLTKRQASKSYRWKIWTTLRQTLARERKLGRYPFSLDEVTPEGLQPEYVPLTRHLLMPALRKLMAELPKKRRAAVAFVVAFGADMGCLPRAEPGDIVLTGKVPHARVRGSKTRHRDRVVPVVAPFEDLAKEAAAGIPFEPWPSMRRDLMRAATRAGVGDIDPQSGLRHITARDLRRSHGRILRAAGVDPALIASMLGHAPGSPVTAMTYAQIQTSELASQIKRAVSRSGTVRRKKSKKAGKNRAA